VEFDRAERNLLRGEIRSLDQKLQLLFEDFKGRLRALENSDPGRRLEQLRNELREKELVPFMERSDGQFQEIAARLKDLGSQVTGQAYAAAERLRGLEGKIDGFAARASEIEDVKDQVESVQRMFESLATLPTEGAAAGSAQIEAEAAAFRSEVRRTLQSHSEQAAAEKAELERLRTQMQALQSSVESVLSKPRPEPPDLTEDFRLIIDGLSEIRTLMQALADKLQPPTCAARR
jgi:soluble cytochrome b562